MRSYYIEIISSQLQSANQTASTSIKLTEIRAKQFKRTKQTKLQRRPFALQLIDGQLWCGLKDGIQIYSTNLQKQRAIEFEDKIYIGGIAEVDDDKVAVAARDVLVLIDKQGDASDFCQNVYSL